MLLFGTVVKYYLANFWIFLFGIGILAIFFLIPLREFITTKKARIICICVISSLVLISAIFGIDRYGVFKGDYNRQCSFGYCDNNATYKAITKLGYVDYYCSEHYGTACRVAGVHEKSSSSSSDDSFSSSDSSKIKCDACDRTFNYATTDSKYITRTGMCRNCYRNYCYAVGKTPENYD